MSVALARPVVPLYHEHQVIETRDIIIAMDISGSMEEAMPQKASTTGSSTPGTNQQEKRKVDVAAASIGEFIKLRPDDRIALAVFDDDTYWHWPLSDDQDLLLRKTAVLNEYTGFGTNFDGPSEYTLGTGPIQAAINHFRKYGESKSRVFVLVTDGAATIDKKRFEELAAQMQQLNIHIYVIGVGSDWTGNSSYTQDLRRFVDRLDGTALVAGDTQDLNQAMNTINALEKSQVKVERDTTYKEVYSGFLVAAIVLWLGFLSLCALTRERI